MAKRNVNLPNWMMDAVGAPRSGRVLDPIEDDEEKEARVSVPGGGREPLLRGGAGGGPEDPLAALAASMGGPPMGGPPPGGAPPVLPTGGPPDLGPPPMPGGGPPIPGAPGASLPPPLPPTGGIMPSLNLPPSGSGDPPMGRPPMPAPGANLSGIDIGPPPVTMPPPPIIPPVEPKPISTPTVGVGGAMAPGGQAPVWNVTNSVINVGQQRVSTQGNNPQTGSTDLAAPMPTLPSVDSLGPPSTETASTPTLGPAPISAMDAGSPPVTLPPFRPITSSPSRAPAAAAPDAASLGPTWSESEGRYL
jgi:hypothetical protein